MDGSASGLDMCSHWQVTRDQAMLSIPLPTSPGSVGEQQLPPSPEGGCLIHGPKEDLGLGHLGHSRKSGPRQQAKLQPEVGSQVAQAGSPAP